jgi:hypothetical protein
MYSSHAVGGNVTKRVKRPMMLSGERGITCEERNIITEANGSMWYKVEENRLHVAFKYFLYTESNLTLAAAEAHLT